MPADNADASIRLQEHKTSIPLATYLRDHEHDSYTIQTSSQDENILTMGSFAHKGNRNKIK